MTRTDLGEAGARLETVRSEWVGLIEREPELDRARIAKWDPTVQRLRQERDRLRGEGRWVGGPADLMSVLGVARSELRHSAALAWLLNPAGQHRLVPAFLEAILEHCFGPGDHGPLASTRTDCEVRRPQCIADIVVWAESFTLVIENKVDAAEGHRQCQRIFEDFADEDQALLEGLGGVAGAHLGGDQQVGSKSKPVSARLPAAKPEPQQGTARSPPLPACSSTSPWPPPLPLTRR